MIKAEIQNSQHVLEKVPHSSEVPGQSHPWGPARRGAPAAASPSLRCQVVPHGAAGWRCLGRLRLLADARRNSLGRPTVAVRLVHGRGVLPQEVPHGRQVAVLGCSPNVVATSADTLPAESPHPGSSSGGQKFPFSGVTRHCVFLCR